MTSTPAQTAVHDELDVDVVVVGAGGGGLAAALAASDAGASVVVLEKLDAPGGNTALSTGSIPATKGTRRSRPRSSLPSVICEGEST